MAPSPSSAQTRWRVGALTLIALLLLTTPALAQPLCEGGGVTVSADFERARAERCTLDAARMLDIWIAPESQPINDSAWFAFRVSAATDTPLTVRLRYDGGTHRYRPKVSADLSTWSALADSDIEIAADKREARFPLTATPGGVYVAAQPLETIDQALAQWQGAISERRLLKTEIGRSVNGRAITALATPSTTTRHALVLLARQHPPETTGAVAFDAFLARLLEDDALAKAFRANVAVLAIPILNPDGIAGGHWRHNSAGVDLNRDWGPFAQPETRAVGRAITHVARTRPLIALIDFHATRRDVIYAQPSGDQVFPQSLVEDWFARWRAAAGDAAPPLSRAHDPTQANAKTWSRLQFGVSGVTYEVGDDTDLTEIRAQARLSAESFMEAWMALSQTELDRPSSASGDARK